MILLFLGDWRPHNNHCDFDSPFDPCFDHCSWARSGETINIMTLGGLALAVGILVDDATVEIENIERNLAMRQGTASRRFSTAHNRSLCRPSFPR